MCGHTPDIVKNSKFHLNPFGFWSDGGEGKIWPFPLVWLLAFTRACTIVQAVVSLTGWQHSKYCLIFRWSSAAMHLVLFLAVQVWHFVVIHKEKSLKLMRRNFGKWIRHVAKIFPRRGARNMIWILLPGWVWKRKMMHWIFIGRPWHFFTPWWGTFTRVPFWLCAWRSSISLSECYLAFYENSYS